MMNNIKYLTARLLIIGWTVAAFMIEAIAVGAAGFLMADGAIAGGTGAGGTASTIGGIGVGTTMIAGGVIGGTVYAADAFANKSANSFTQAQEGAFGSVQNGVSNPQAPSNEYLQRLVTLTETRQIVADFGASLGSNKKVLFGDCPAYVAASSCAASGLDPGTLPRPDTLKEADNMKSVYLRYLYCRDNLGLSGSQLQKCAAPILDINDPTTVYYSTPDFN